MGACTVPGEMAIVMELCERGNLEQLLHNKNANLSLFRRMQMAKDIAMGMCWLHKSNPAIIHRDLKPSNLLVDKFGRIKICGIFFKFQNFIDIRRELFTEKFDNRFRFISN